MEDYFKMVFFSDFLHENHQHHILVNCLDSLTEYRGTLKLVRSHLIVTCLKKDTELVCFCFEILHEIVHP